MPDGRWAIVILLSLLAAMSAGCRDTHHSAEQPRAAIAVRDTTANELRSGLPRVAVIDTATTNVAWFIAGMAPLAGSGLDSLTSTATWREYHQMSDRAWRDFLTHQYAGVRRFSATIPAIVDSGATVLYPFSGPDLLYVHAMFPTAERYVMFGLEPPGAVPDLDAVAAGDVQEVMQAAAASIEEIISCSFFRTIDMRTEMSTSHLQGTLPIVMQLAVRTGNHIVDVRFFSLDADGRPVYREAPAAEATGYGTGFELELSDADDGSTRHTVVYLCCDASDNGMAGSGKRAGEYLQRIDGQVVCYIKAASYLMHKSYFSNIRSLILARSALIVQDDSGIPFRFFTPDVWMVHLYGSYTEPIDMFKEFTQDDLVAAYSARTAELGVRFGYLRQSAVQVAVKRRGP